MNGRLHEKVAIITGAGTGIGEAIALKFAREGARLVLNGLPDDPVEDVARAIRGKGGQAVSYQGDISDEDHAQRCVQKALDAYGRLDILVNNAGVFLVTSEVQKYPVEDFDRTLRMNVRSAFLMTRYALPHLQKTRGNILNAGSESGEVGLGMNAPYGGTKGWLHAFTRGVAYEQAKYGVRANCVCPGPIDTAWTHKETGPMTPKMEEALVAGTVLGRRGTPEEIANIYAFLASDEASYVTGALFFADGGTTIAKGAPGEEVPRELQKEPADSLGTRHALDGEQNKDYHVIG